MMTRNLSVATIALGVLGASIGACSAQSSGTPPRPNDGAGNASNGGAATANPSSGGSSPTNTGTGNTGNTGNTASGGTSSNTGTGPGAPGGTIPGSTGGSGGSAGAGGAGPVTGSSGAATASAGCPLVVATPDQLIDDLEDGNNQIATVGSRIGYWYTYNDMSGGTQTPTTSATMPFKPLMGGGHCGSMYSAHTSGNALFTVFGAGLGFDFNNVGGVSTVYNASAYTGISFWAKGSPGIRAMIKIPATTISTSPGGTCVAPAAVTPACLCECENHFAINPALTGDWAQYKLPFATITQDPTWGKQVTFDKTKILAVQFQVVKAVAFDFSIDDVTFY